MAVQQRRKTRSRRDMRRSHDGLKRATLSIDPSSGETHLRHHISPDGFYRGKQVVIQQVIFMAQLIEEQREIYRDDGWTPRTDTYSLNTK